MINTTITYSVFKFVIRSLVYTENFYYDFLNITIIFFTLFKVLGLEHLFENTLVYYNLH